VNISFDPLKKNLIFIQQKKIIKVLIAKKRNVLLIKNMKKKISPTRDDNIRDA
jgi:hypothetical protein